MQARAHEVVGAVRQRPRQRVAVAAEDGVCEDAGEGWWAGRGKRVGVEGEDLRARVGGGAGEEVRDGLRERECAVGIEEAGSLDL